MRKACNYILLCGAMIVLFGTLACTVVDRAGCNFPSWMGVNAKHSNLEGRNYTTIPELSIDSVLSGDFQNSFEDYVADLVPMRDEILLANAELQRTSIKEMASIAGYDKYPTFFGSDCYFDSTYGVLGNLPTKESDVDNSALNQMASGIASFADGHPDSRFLLSVPGRSGFLSFGDEFVSGSVSSDTVGDLMVSSLSGAVPVIKLNPENYSEYSEDYYKNDHHWNIRGAYKAYCSISRELGHGDDLIEPLEEVSFPVDFYGSEARTGLDMEAGPDAVVDYAFTLPEYDVYSYGKKRNSNSIKGYQEYKDGKNKTEAFLNHYAAYYHGDFPSMVLKTKENRGKGSLLIVGDSFTNCMERMFLENYDTVYVFDPRHSGQTLGEYVAENGQDIDDILFMMSYQTLVDEKAISNIR